MGKILGTAARLLLRLFNWELVGRRPPAPKLVMIAAPHTSNWDLPIMLAVGAAVGVKLSWIGKAEIFRGPAGPLFRALGGIPVAREQRNNLVEYLTGQFAAKDELVLAIAPAGTRKQTPFWRSGFYRIALGANVPIVCGFIDYGKRQTGVGPLIHLSGDQETDLDKIRAFYDGMTGKFPQNTSPITFRPPSA